MVTEAPDTGTCGWMIKKCIFPTPEAVAVALAASIQDFLNSEIAQATAIMLPGGRTPKAAYDRVAASGATAGPNHFIAITDDRQVPPDDPGSNARMMRPFLEAIGCPESQRLFVDTTLSREDAAQDFGRRLNEFIGNGGRIDTCFLGLGADGHTASLFTRDDLARCEDQGAIDVDRPDGRAGISATPRILRSADRLVFVVTGSEKRDIVKDLLTSPLSTTAGRVVQGHPAVELWIDAKANPGAAPS